MRLEFEPNASAAAFVENEVVNQKAASNKAENLLREGVRSAQEGRRAEARALLLQVTELDADNENAWLWLASISEYPEELLVFLNNVLRINQQNERALEWHKATRSLLAKTLVQRGVDALEADRREFARQCFEQALGHEAENEMAWLWMASVADSDDEKAACFEKVLSANPQNETAQSSLRAIQSQKTRKIFADSLAAAFDGKHSDAKALLEDVLSRDAELEEAWELKSHLAESFEERAECFLKLRGLNPENELARAALASWRTLSENLAEMQPAEENFKTGAEFQSAESKSEVDSHEFSDYPAMESVAQNEAPEFSAESEVLEAPALEALSPETTEQSDEAPAYLTEEDSNYGEFYNHEAPTQDLSTADFAPTASDNSGEQNQSPEPQPAEASSFAEFQSAEASFENADNEAAFEEPQQEFAAATKAEEEHMHWAFNEPQESKEAEDFFRNFDADDDIHKTQSANKQDTYFSNFEAENNPQSFAVEPEAEPAEKAVETSFADLNEELSDEWRNTSPTVFVNYAADEPAENSFEADVPEFSYAEPVLAEEAPAEDFAVPAEDFAVVEEKDEMPVGFDENDFSSPDFEVSAEEIVEAVEVQAEEHNLMETSEPQPQEDFPQPKNEPVLCPFCNAENEKQAFSCASCQTILTLSDLEMLLNQHSADVEKVHRAVTSLERENASYGLNAEQLTNLGIGHVNLKNYRHGFNYLQEAVRLNPNNVLLDAQVNALAIRLSEIEEQQTAHEAMPKNRKILVVDDSPTVRKLISGKLEKCGHEVICAVDGLDALQKINELQPDLVLLDITMPRMDGYQVCKMIRSNEATKDVPVVMISGKDGFFDKVRGRMAGTTGYITKPFGPETLMKTVETYLN